MTIQCETKKDTFDIISLSGKDLHLFCKRKLDEISTCYMNVFNESWGEDWTLESAKDEVSDALQLKVGRKPIATFLIFNGLIVGFAWGILMHKDSLSADRDMPFYLPEEEKELGLNVTKYWLMRVAKKDRIFLFRELGVLKGYRRNVSTILTKPLFYMCKEQKHNVAVLSTNLSSQVFKWAMCYGMTPYHFFQQDDLILMAGSIKQTIYFHESEISSRSLLNNVRNYMCRD